MSDLVTIFRQGTAAYIRELESMLPHVTGSGASVELVQYLKSLTQKLEVAGDAYGFPAVVAAARAFDEAPDTRMREMLEKLISELRNAGRSNASNVAEILVIDNDPFIHQLIDSFMASSNRKLTYARSAAEAIELLKDSKWSLILLDLVLPDADGRRLLKQLKEQPATSTIPVIVITGRESPLIAEECYGMGVGGYFGKPLQLIPLAIAIEDSLAKSTRHIVPAEASAPPVEVAAQVQQQPAIVSLYATIVQRIELSSLYQRMKAQTTTDSSDWMIGLMHYRELPEVLRALPQETAATAVDRLVAAIAKLMPAASFFARWSEREFVFLLPDTKSSAAAVQMENLLKEITHLAVNELQSGTRASVAVSISDPRSSSNLEEAVAQAQGSLIGTGSRTEKPRILVAEDDPVNALVVKHRMEREGFDVVVAENGKLALDMAPQVKPVLFILDIRMPEMDGFELLAKLRSDPQYNRVPVVMLTSMGNERDVVRGFDLGAQDYIIKPFDPSELVTRIMRVLSVHRL